jgi:ribose transport system permease protein
VTQTTERTDDAPATPRAGRKLSLKRLQPLSIAFLTVILCVVSLSYSNNPSLWLSNLLNYAAGVGIIACGMTFVMVAGGFDLSVGSIAAVCGVVVVLVMQHLPGMSPWVSIPVACLATLGTGALLGAINGWLIAYVGVNPFVVTLSSMFVFRGIGLVLTSGGQSQVVPLALNEPFRLLYWGGINLFGFTVPMPVIVFAVVFLISVYGLGFTRFGHYTYATGGNANASWLAGINTKRLTTTTYVLSGLSCAVAAILWCSLSGTAQASDYTGKEMIVIASVIVGGTPLGGGRGGLFSTLSGLFLLCTIDQLLTLMRVDPQYRQIVTGLIIVTVVAIDAYVKRAGKR